MDKPQCYAGDDFEARLKAVQEEWKTTVNYSLVEESGGGSHLIVSPRKALEEYEWRTGIYPRKKIEIEKYIGNELVGTISPEELRQLASQK